MTTETCGARGAQLWKRLRSTRLTLFILTFIALYAGALVWLPWVSGQNSPPPGWAVHIGVDRPFSSYPFLLASLLLFVNSFACTWERAKKVLRIWNGDFPVSCRLTSAGSFPNAERFLVSQGFRRKGEVFFRHRIALWGGLVLHLGILLLLASISVQRSLHDGASFELVEGEAIRLADDGAVFARERGWLAPTLPPALEVNLVSFDAFLHQKGYAPDRASRLRISAPDGGTREELVDRAKGVALGDVTVYQAIPSGLALNLSIPGLGVRSVHLRSKGGKTASSEIRDPAGRSARFVIEAERELDDPMGTGQLRMYLEQGGEKVTLAPGVPFEFGSVHATLVSVARWGGFTYSRSPGIGLVFAGFALILSGCFLLVFPAGAARLPGPGDDGVILVYVARGEEALRAEWELHCTADTDGAGGTR